MIENSAEWWKVQYEAEARSNRLRANEIERLEVELKEYKELVDFWIERKDKLAAAVTGYHTIAQFLKAWDALADFWNEEVDALQDAKEKP